MTLDELKARLALYVAAEAAILTGAQEYQVGAGQTARRLTRADLAEVRSEILGLMNQIAAASPQRARRITYLRPY